MRIVAASESAFLILFDEAITPQATRSVHALAHALRSAPLAGQIDFHPAYSSVLVRFECLRVSPRAFQAELERCLQALPQFELPTRELFELPLSTTDDEAPDLAALAQHAGLSRADTLALFVAPIYTVSFLGFAPGFPYLSGLDPRLQMPRRANPRLRVPAGSVAIGAAQAGIYPLASPGGWNLIGHCSTRLFDAQRAVPALLQAGDRVRFVLANPEESPT